MGKLYLIAGAFIAPFIPLWLAWRAWRGKEDRARLSERMGRTKISRPEGTLVWLHAASVGEAVSVLPLIERLRAQWPHHHVLLTTGTRTSAALMQVRLPKDVIHQYVPVDTAAATWQFMRHWRPDIALFVESEFWPNLVKTANTWQCFMAVVNARMSERSFAFWRKYPSFISGMLTCFNVMFAQSDGDKARLEKLGAKNVFSIGNLKYDAPPLPCDESALLTLKAVLGARPVWLAASTHPGEEAMIAEAHGKLAARFPGLLTIIVPRHPERGVFIAAELQKRFTVGMRSRGDGIKPETGIYIGDTLGELGLFYRLSEIVFMGGSLVKHGGQNPLEPARLACAIVTGPHTHNFSDIYRDLERAKACVRASGPKALTAQLETLLDNDALAQDLQAAAKYWVERQSGATDRLLEELGPIFRAARKS